MITLPRAAQAQAHANIALAKYWGKADAARNLPAVPSVSLCLQALCTTTDVCFAPELACDQLWLNGQRQEGKALARAVALLDRVRAQAGFSAHAQVLSHNNFPTASGLASSASAFAALALAARCAAGLALDLQQASDLARRSSASAARSLYGGFVKLPAGQPEQDFLPAQPIAPAEHWDLRVVIALTSLKAKAVGSTDGMLHTACTSPYYPAWISLSEQLAPRLERAILERDFTAVGTLAEHSALSMHACAMAAFPAVLYFNPATLACIQAVRDMRAQGLEAYVTIDAGPHVKVLTLPENQAEIECRLGQVPGVLQTITSRLGPQATVEERDPIR